MNTEITGILAEDYADNYLRASNYHVLNRNWYHGKDEIDIIARSLDSDQLVFVEVKALTSQRDPLDNFSPSKEICLQRAVEGYLDRYKLWDHNFRIDVITMNIHKNMSVSAIDHYQDVI